MQRFESSHVGTRAFIFLAASSLLFFVCPLLGKPPLENTHPVDTSPDGLMSPSSL